RVLFRSEGEAVLVDVVEHPGLAHLGAGEEATVVVAVVGLLARLGVRGQGRGGRQQERKREKEFPVHDESLHVVGALPPSAAGSDAPPSWRAQGMDSRASQHGRGGWLPARDTRRARRWFRVRSEHAFAPLTRFLRVKEK